MAHVIINYDSHTIIIRFLPVWLTYVRTCMRLLFLYIFFFLVLAFGYDCEWHKQIAFAILIACRCRPIYVQRTFQMRPQCLSLILLGLSLLRVCGTKCSMNAKWHTVPHSTRGTSNRCFFGVFSGCRRFNFFSISMERPPAPQTDCIRW